MANIADRLKDVRRILIIPYDGRVRVTVEMQVRAETEIEEIQLFVEPENMEAVVATFLRAMTLKL